jgi:hypothetical protein
MTSTFSKRAVDLVEDLLSNRGGGGGRGGGGSIPASDDRDDRASFAIFMRSKSARNISSSSILAACHDPINNYRDVRGIYYIEYNILLSIYLHMVMV